MNVQTLARKAYADTVNTTRTERSIEYELMARVTHRMKAAAEAGPVAFPRLVEALYDNRRLWTALATDVADGENALPSDLRARIFYLAEFMQIHTSKVLNKKAGIAPILQINVAVMRGLNGKGSAK